MSVFFGMNTGGLPFVHDNDGTLKVVLIALILEIIVFLPFLFINTIQKSKSLNDKDQNKYVNLPYF
jgi:hypothetical protein